MSIVDETFGLIDRGRSGEVAKLKTNIPKLDEVIYGIKQGYTYLIGGATGAGKSSFARSIFIDNVYDQYKLINDSSKFDVKFLDFTLEIPPSLNLATTITRKAFLDYQKILPVNKLFSWTGTVLAEEDYRIVQSYKDWAREYQRKFITVDSEVSPNLYHDILMEAAKTVGTFSREGRYIDECGHYTPNNPNLYMIVLFDTLNLAATDSEHTTVKSSIDRISKIGLRFRNKCNFIIVDVQQYNSDVQTTDRARFGVQGPTLKDFMESSGPTKDSTVVLGLYSPILYLRDEQTTWRGYNMEVLKNWLVSIHVLKNRYGQASRYIPCKFDGAVSLFTQLKAANEMGELDYIEATRH